jgi:hypothetical protein
VAPPHLLNDGWLQTIDIWFQLEGDAMETQHTVSAATVLSFAEDLISVSVPPSRLEALLDTPLDDLSDPEAQVQLNYWAN